MLFLKKNLDGAIIELNRVYRTPGPRSAPTKQSRDIVFCMHLCKVEENSAWYSDSELVQFSNNYGYKVYCVYLMLLQYTVNTFFSGITDLHKLVCCYIIIIVFLILLISPALKYDIRLRLFTACRQSTALGFQY